MQRAMPISCCTWSSGLGGTRLDSWTISPPSSSSCQSVMACVRWGAHNLKLPAPSTGNALRLTSAKAQIQETGGTQGIRRLNRKLRKDRPGPRTPVEGLELSLGHWRKVTRLWRAFCHSISYFFTFLRGPDSHRLAVTIGPYVPFPARRRQGRDLLRLSNRADRPRKCPFVSSAFIPRKPCPRAHIPHGAVSSPRGWKVVLGGQIDLTLFMHNSRYTYST